MSGSPDISAEPAEPAPTAAAASGPLQGVNSCALLDARERSQLGLPDGRGETVGHARACTYEVRGTGGPGYRVGVDVYDDLGLKDLAATDKPVGMSLGRHQAVRSHRSGGAICAITIAVTETSRVDVQGSDALGEDTKACDRAVRVARIVEPKLP